jgi:hypothetical protein
MSATRSRRGDDFMDSQCLSKKYKAKLSGSATPSSGRMALGNRQYDEGPGNEIDMRTPRPGPTDSPGTTALRGVTGSYVIKRNRTHNGSG